MQRTIVFETERMVGSRWLSSDVRSAMDLYGDPDVMRYLGGPPWKDLAEAEEKLAWLMARDAGWGEGMGGFPVFRKADGVLLGAVLAKWLPGDDKQPTEDFEIGWHLIPKHQGHGYATEGGRAIMAHAFRSHPLEEVIAVVEPPNVAAIRVAERLGMRYVGRTTKYYDRIELEKFVIGRDEWSAAVVTDVPPR